MPNVSTVFSTGLVVTWLVGATMSAQNLGGDLEAKKVKNPVRATVDSVAAGEKVFQKYCSFCHGPGGKGDGELAPKDTHPADLTDAKWDHGSSDGEIFATIQNGVGPKFDMKGFKGRLSDTDIWNVLNYVRSLGPTKNSH